MLTSHLPNEGARERCAGMRVKVAYFLDRCESLEITSLETCFYDNIAKQRASAAGEFLGLVPSGLELIRVWFCVVLCRARAQLSLSKWSENGGLH